MKFGNLSRIGAMATVAVFVVGLAHHSRALQPARPNILFCLADDWGPDQAGALGNTYIKTPTFDRLAREGVLLTNAHDAVPSCTASRAAILTGQMPHRLGSAMNLSSEWRDIPALYTDILSAHGYLVGSTRKGWGPGKHPGRELEPAGKIYKDFEEFLAARPAGTPFCFWFGSYDPHRGYNPKLKQELKVDPGGVIVPPYLPDVPAVRGDLADYYAEVQRFDTETGQLLKRLQDIGELDNTIVVMTGDNGLPFPRAKGHLYDFGTTQPLAIRWGEKIKPGRKATDFISFTDFAPTFLEVAGIPAPKIMTGRSFLDVLLSDKNGRVDRSRNKVFTERERHTWAQPDGQSYPVRAVRTDDYLYVRNFRPQLYPAGHPFLRRANRTPKGFVDCDEGPSKYYIIDHKDDPAIASFYKRAFDLRPPEELYDVRKDPYELNNVAQDRSYARALAQMRSELEKWMKKTGDPRANGETSQWDGSCVHLQPYADVKMPGYEEAEKRSAQHMEELKRLHLLR